MKGLLVLVFSVLFCLNTSAQFLQDGQCNPSITLQANFNPDQFSGTWYEIGRSDNPSEGGDCSSWTITGNMTGYQFSYSSLKKNIPADFIAEATLEMGTARFTLNYETTENVDFWILGTNYQNYSVVYGCENVDTSQRKIYIWHLGRETTISPLFDNTMNSLVRPLGITLNELRRIEHTEYACTSLPVIDQGQPIILPGHCDGNITLLTDFDASRFIGTWHEIHSYYSENAPGQCSRADYTLGGGVVNVVNSQVIGQALDIIIGTATVADAATAKLKVVLQVAPEVTAEQDIWIIDTDYVNYAISYSCQNINAEFKRVFSWIVSRERQLSTESQVRVNEVVDSILDLNFAYYQETDQSDGACDYTPGQFVGECDLTIPAADNFQPELYTGLWHDIESYSTGFQEGTCSNAYYSLIDGVVDVFNTQVINQTLDTIRGVAVPISTDGSAKLEVTFPIVGTDLFITSNYWVLATDYISYSLVYSCSYNNQTNTKSVFSWKLSRTKSLSNEANDVINNITSGIPVLDDRFYIVRDQSPEACFYFPDPQPGVHVIFPGECDDSIPAVANFNLDQFQGEWYEIETYPKPHSGECVLHEYTQSNNGTVHIASSFLVNGFAATSTSVLQLDSTDNSGKFTIRINDGTQELEIPFWILSINYNDYAFAYSCVELDYERRAIYSWKLSRNRQGLSAAAQTQIYSVITSIDVLEERYYETLQQDEEECVPLPEIPAGLPIILDGRCSPNIPVVQNFTAADFLSAGIDTIVSVLVSSTEPGPFSSIRALGMHTNSPANYLGTWHLIESYWSEFQGGVCNDATYSLQADGSVLVVNTQVINQELDSATLVATVSDIDGSGKLSVKFENSPFPVDYWIIDTDYTSYSLVYSCENLLNNKQHIWSWKLSRTKSLTPEAVESIDKSISTIRVLNNAFYYTISNTDEDCFYYPEPDGKPVVFRGKCNETLPVVTDFDAVQYMGLWYNIESYPQPFQEGSCATAEYELRDGVVDVFNTQVVNQTLDVIRGRAVLVETNDAEAKLEVTFPIAGIGDAVSPYWVLATDYTDYALVYACQNLGPDRRSVSSWKLSRQRTLSMTAEREINETIANVDILQQRYYEVKGHTDADCFYYPEPNGKPVVLRGQCDHSIAAFPDFDLERFAGVWNEIETYPKDQVGGQCINHEFTVTATSNATLQLTSNQVFDSETLISNEGQIVLDSTDGSGRFTLTINTSNETIVIPYWVLDTDYANYALVYSCMNRDIETKAVYSWKLSRSKQLSIASNAAINAAMESIDVLEQRYFEDVSQTDQSCFYLPEIGPNEPAVLPGRCDLTINVITNFDADRFSGRWFDIESYYDDYEGTCVDGNFTRTNNGFDVIFTQVIDQTLDSTFSAATLAADGSGKLIVNNNGLTFEYWILDSDYTNWALLYSCDNQGNDHRRVRSWKMSRTRQLSNESNIAIDAIVDSIDVLNERYFNSRDHSLQGCFYFPEPNGLPVKFRGRCDSSIQVVQNFSAEDYLGQWYDIQSYPQFFQDGECATALYSDGDGRVDVFNTQVVNQQLDTINGSAVVASDDGSAKLDVTFVVNGFEVVSPYWVLSTDYTSYSLVYSCSEIDDEYISVSAWKLSRTRNLTLEAEEEINEVMSNVQVLDQQYFRKIGHSETDCFFYPDNNEGPVILDGVCPSSDEVNVVTNFNVNSFSGTWREFYRFPSERQEGECSFTEYVVHSNSEFSIVDNIVNDESLITTNNTGLVSDDGRGVISIRSRQLFVLDTDYNEFALLYECQQLDNSSKQIYSWILSRSRDGISQAATERVNTRVDEEDDLFRLYYEATSQTNDACFYYPEFENVPPFIELPGPCNENIQAMPNFDAARYLGRWFETSRYPQPNQIGECAQATYSPSEGVVKVLNTEVVNRTLLVQEGTAVVSSVNGTGVLEVTFVVGAQTIVADYYVLATDYNNYALVYSCRNLNNGNSQVFSWKLSRDRSLSNVANQAINNVIDNTRGLRNDYYIDTSQNDIDCFYVPEPNPDEPVLFRGQCKGITGMQNFDVQKYLGVWHEVERYPTGQDDGECVSSNYQSSGNTFQVFDTKVYGDRADISNTVVTVSSDGRISRAGQGDVWVIDTDYDSYAVLLSCEEYDEEYRQVWSAKHSRTRNLPETAESAISQVLENNDLLHQQFYLEVDQSDDACFYYPDDNDGHVILPGQCDGNIPVMTDFKIAEFTGSWYQIERYPQIQESGNCSGARYTLDVESGVVTVLNWEVVDGKLETIEGTAVKISDDGRARLRVTLPSKEEEGQEVVTDLYVLTTDYVTYALAYSCQNVDQYRRKIGAWKLSRERTLPANSDGVRAINAYMEQRKELEQRYFVTVPQNENCVEPNSSFLIKSSIILLLVCSILQKLLLI